MREDLYVGPSGGELHLKFAVRTINQRILYTAVFMQVYAHEYDLDAGRFKRFSYTEQDFCVMIRRHHEDEPLWLQTERWINWIAEHHEGTWSFRPVMEHVTCGRFYISFDDLPTATMFKLLFG